MVLRNLLIWDITQFGAKRKIPTGDGAFTLLAMLMSHPSRVRGLKRSHRCEGTKRS